MKIRVILLEENREIAELVEAALTVSRFEFEVNAAVDFPGAIDLLDSLHFNVMFVNHDVIDSAREPVVEIIRSSNPHLPIILLTNDELDRSDSQSLAIDVDGMICTSELSVRGLLRAIQEAVGRHRRAAMENQTDDRGHDTKRLVVEVQGDLIRIDADIDSLESCMMEPRGRDSIHNIRAHVKRISERLYNFRD